MTAKTQATAMNVVTLALADLRVDEKSNVRKIGRGADPQMMASIKAIGLRQPLLVRPNGKGHVVIDGGQRLEAIKALVEKGDLPKDFAVPVIVDKASDTAARETSLALNIIRTDMHPVDEYRAFHDLHVNDKMTVDDIAARYGKTVKGVVQRLALGDLDEKVLAAWREGRIDEDAATAFTLTSDKKAQARALEKFKDGGRVSRWHVMQALKLKQGHEAAALDLVGEEAYTKRGGKVTRDMFGTDHQLSNPQLLRTMIEELLDTTCKQLVEQNGWGFALRRDEVDNRWSYGELPVQPRKPTKEEAARMKVLKKTIETSDDGDNEIPHEEYEAAETELEQIELSLKAFTPEQKKMAGCFVALRHDSSCIEIEYGKTKPSDKKLITVGKDGSVNKKKAPLKGADFVSQALLERLSEQLTTASARTLAAQPHIAVAAMLAGFASNHQTCGVHATGAGIRGTSFESAFEAAMKMTDAQQIKALAEIAAKSTNFKFFHSKDAPMKHRSVAALCNAIDAKAFNKAAREAFDAKDYFESVGRPQIVAAVREVIGPDQAEKVAKMKKPEAVKFAVANVPGTGWLPTQLRTANYDGPKAKASPKKAATKKAAKKAKPAKRATKAKKPSKRK